VTRPALMLGPRDYLERIRANLVADGIPQTVAEHDTPSIVDWLIGISQLQGISDRNAIAYSAA
jgi:hypothetical protein